MDKNRKTTAYGSFGRHAKAIYALCAVLAFAGAAAGIAYYNMRTAHSLYLQSDDGDLYLSIARNMLENAHFIQTARPIESFVVPPGLPAMCTLLLFFGGKLSSFFIRMGFADHAIRPASPDMLGLLGFQYLIYGAAAALMAVTALKLAEYGLGASQRGIFAWQKSKAKMQAVPDSQDLQHAASAEGSQPEPSRSKRYPAAMPWILAMLIGLLAPAFYIYCSTSIRHPNPGFILTENYVVFLIALILWLAVRGADPRRICAFAFILMLFRPACSALFLAAFLWVVIRAFRDRFGKKRPKVARRIHFYDIFVMLAVFACVIGINTAINYLETGEIIPLEDYGNLDVYLANNEKAGPDWYHSGKVPEFASPRYNEILAAPGLTRYQQNELAGEALKDYVRNNTDTVIRYAGIRFEKLFCETWGPVFYAFLVCLILQMLLKALRWQQKMYLAVMAVFLAGMPAFGLLVARYSAPMLPLFIGLILGTAGELAAMLCMLERNGASAAVPAPEASNAPEANAVSADPEEVESPAEKTSEPEASEETDAPTPNSESSKDTEPPPPAPVEESGSTPETTG